MRRSLFLLLFPWTISGCFNSATTQLGSECSYSQEIVAVDSAMETGAIFLFGERHGTSEAPAFVAEFACRIARMSQEPTIVVFELAVPEVLSDLSIEHMSVLDAQKLILAGDDNWSKQQQYGITSAAMMDAILRILELREEGVDIALGSIYPNDDTKSKYNDLVETLADEGARHNRYFQEALQISHYKDEFKNVIVLSGKVHTRNYLRFFDRIELDETYLGFVQESGGGYEWNCQPLDGGCRVHSSPTQRRSLVESAENASLVMLNNNEDIFDGVFIFKSTSPSYPYRRSIIER